MIEVINIGKYVKQLNAQIAAIKLCILNLTNYFAKK